MGKKIYLIDSESTGHHAIYLNSLKEIEETCQLKVDVDINGNINIIISILKYYKAIRKQLLAIPKGNIAHLLYSDIYYKIPFISSKLLQRNKTIVTMHSFPKGKIKNWLMKNFCKRVEAVVVHSEYIKKQLLSLGLNNIYYIDYPSFYDYSNILSRNELKRREGIKDTDIIITALGGIRKDKGLDILLEAFKYIDDKYKNRIILNIAGKEGFLSATDIQHICKLYKIRTRLNIRPLSEIEFMENVNLSDYMIMPYRCNMTGNSGPMTEAIVRGIPSIVPKGSNLGYIAEKYKIGLTFEQENPYDLAKTLIYICTHAYKMNDEYSKELSKSIFINKHKKLYNKISEG